MTRKKKKLIDKIVKKDYNNALEEVLSRKIYQEEVKNLLLDILYRVEISYKDYETVKKNVLPKEDYLNNIIKTIKEDCESINFLKATDVKTRKLAVSKERKQILCFPTLTRLLYAIAKIRKSEDIVKEESDLLNKTFTDMINIGNNINTVEPLRDFNGYSWNISANEIENFYYNLIYQDLIILVGNNLLEEWINTNDRMIDYMELFEGDLERNYGKQLTDSILDSLKVLSVLLEAETNTSFEKEITERMKEIHNELNLMANRIKYLEDMSDARKKLIREIGDIDFLLNDKERLAYEYERRNRKLPLEEKIFSKRVFANILRKEREQKVKKLQEFTKKMNSVSFLENQRRLCAEQEYVILAEKDVRKPKIISEMYILQKYVLEAFKIKIKNALSKETLTKIIYEIRYYNLIPVNLKNNISGIARIKKELDEVKNRAISKMYEFKMINKICKDPEKNQEVIKNIFSLNIIKLEDINLKILKGNDGKNYIQFYDDNVEDSTFETNLKKEDFKIRINKKVKLFKF